MDNSVRVGLSVILFVGGVFLSSLTHADSANTSEDVDEHTVHSIDIVPSGDSIPIAPGSHNARSEHRDPIMPELVEYLGFGKGAYYMDVGDLAPTGYGDYYLADYFDRAGVFNMQAGYRFSNDLSLQMDVFNLLDVNDFSIVHFLESQWYGGRLGEHKFGDVYVHPVEPRTIQLRLKLQF